MAANKNKIVALAQRYTLKGQFEKAIAEYRKLLKTDPQDIRTWLKIGDLYTRMGARKEATETYIRVAEQYTHAGFHLKAIAVYKQVLSIDPTMVVIHQYLAASYLELGLTSEALIQLEQLADVYERTQRNDLLLEVLLQMGKIDPRNIATRLRVAELLSKEKRVAEASKHFALACDELKAQGRREDFIKVAERLLYHDPSRIETALEVAALYVERGQYKEALAKLQVCFVKDRKNIDVLDLLAKAFLGLGQPEKAISVMTEMAEVLAQDGYAVRRKEVLQEILSIAPDNEIALAALGKRSATGMEPGGQSLNHAVLGDDVDIITEHSASGIDLLADLTAAENMTAEEIAGQSQALLGKVEVLLKYGQQEKALEHLQKIFDIDPFNIDARETARDILLVLDRRVEALEHLFLLAEVFKTAQPEGAIYYLHEVLKIDRENRRARQMIRDLGGIMPEGMEDTSIVSREEEPTLLDEDEDILVIDDDDLQQADAALLEADDLAPDLEEWDRISEPALAKDAPGSVSISAKNSPSTGQRKDSTVVEVVDYIDDPLDLDEELPDFDDEIAIEDDDEFSEDEEIDEELDPSTLIQSAIPPATAGQADPAIPEDTTDRDAGSASLAPDIAMTAAEAPFVGRSTSKSEIQMTASAAPGSFVSPSAAEKIETSTDLEFPNISDDLEEIEFFLEQELFDEAGAALAELTSKYPDDPRIQALRAKLEATSPETSDLQETDLSPISKRSHVAEPSRIANNEGSVQFKNVGIKEKLSDSDSSTSWDLGLAYKEMGLFEDAILAFEIVARDPTKTGLAKTMIGICQASLSRMDDAVRTFTEGLDAPDLDADKKMGLLYELGKIHQSMGKPEDARKCYEAIIEMDAEFADVAVRIRSIKKPPKSAARI